MSRSKNTNMRVEGVTYPADNRGKTNGASKTSLVRTSQFIWLGMLITIGGMVLMFGTPHLRFKYQYTGSRSHPDYLSCQYIGLHPVRLQPSNGKCPLIAMFK